MAAAGGRWSTLRACPRNRESALPRVAVVVANNHARPVRVSVLSPRFDRHRPGFSQTAFQNGRRFGERADDSTERTNRWTPPPAPAIQDPRLGLGQLVRRHAPSTGMISPLATPPRGTERPVYSNICPKCGSHSSPRYWVIIAPPKAVRPPVTLIQMYARTRAARPLHDRLRQDVRTGSSRASLPCASSLPSSGYSPVKQASQWRSRDPPTAS